MVSLRTRMVVCVLSLLLLGAAVFADDFEELVEAMEADDFGEFQRLMRTEYSVNERNVYGSTPLLWTSGFADPRYAEHLLSLGADIDAVVEDPSGNDDHNGQTGIVVAAWGGNDELVQWYLDNGTDRSFLPEAMEWAARKGKADVARILIPYLPDLDNRASVREGGMTYLAWAANWAEPGATEFMNLLLDAGADPNADPDGEYGVTHFLAQEELPEVTQRFLSMDIDWEKRTHWGATPIFAAAESSLPLTRTLIERGVDLSVVDGFSEMTVLHEAVHENNPYLVQLLVDAGAPLDVRTGSGGYVYSSDGASETLDRDFTPLAYAQYRGYDLIADILTGRRRVEVPEFTIDDEIRYGFAIAFSGVADRPLVDFAGRRGSTLEYQGQVVIHNIWATWCPPCRYEMPSLQRLFDRYGGAELTVLAESVDENPRDAEEYMGDYDLTFPGFHFKSEERDLQNLASAFPTTYIYDATGLQIARVVGSREWDSPELIEFFDRLVGQDGAAAATPSRRSPPPPRTERREKP